MVKSRYNEEIDQFKNVIEIHDLPLIQSYWSQNYLRPKFEQLGFRGMWDFYIRSILEVRAKIGRETLRIVSIGSGNCDVEIELASRLIMTGESEFVIDCIDINSAMLQRGNDKAAERQLSSFFNFYCTGVTGINYPPNTVHIYFAIQSLHHIEDLECLFEHIHASLADNGRFLIGDMIGRNGHTFWPECLFFVNLIWDSMEREKKYHHRAKEIHDLFPNTDYSSVGFEGVRAQDILPLLVMKFHQDVFLGFSSIIRPFISRGYGPNFDAKKAADRSFVNFVATLDDQLIERNVCKPTQCFATFSTAPTSSMRHYRHWSAEYSIRHPEATPQLNF